MRLPYRWRCLALCTAASAAWAQAPYTYIKFSLKVPWTLYFIFLAAVTIPFIVMIVLAWRDRGPEDAEAKVPSASSPERSEREP